MEWILLVSNLDIVIPECGKSMFVLISDPDI
jgi:hypothetical protein